MLETTSQAAISELDLLTMDRELSDLIGAIYDAAMDANIWPAALKKVSDRFLCDETNLVSFSFDLNRATNFVSGRAHHIGEKERSVLLNLRSDRRLTFTQIDQSIFLPIEILDDSALLMISTWKLRSQDKDTPDREDLSTLQNHLKRAIAIKRKKDAPNTLQPHYAAALDKLKCGVLLVRKNLSIDYSNSRAEEMLSNAQSLKISNGTIASTDKEHQSDLHNAVLDVLDNKESKVILAIKEDNKKRAFLIEISSLKNLLIDAPLFTAADPLAMICLSQVGEPDLHFTEAQRNALNLTPMEWTIATSLAWGFTTRKIAEAQGSSPQTVRWHIKQIFAKTNTSRQPELVKLLLDMRPPVAGCGG